MATGLSDKEIRVNTFAEKRAYRQLKLGLAVLGMTVDDLFYVREMTAELKAVKSEEARLKAENESLRRKMGEGSSRSKEAATVADYMREDLYAEKEGM